MTDGRTKTYFLSDIHLGASYIPDKRAHESRVLAFLRSIEGDARTVYFLGDVLDYWFEYRTVVPRGHVRFLGQVARMADMGIRIVWFTGNHDIWLFDYLRDELGIEVIDAPGEGIFQDIDGTRFFLGHGDNFGRQPRKYLMLRAIFHNRLCQRLYAGIHPRWTMPFAYGWSSHSRKGNTYPHKAGMSERTRKNLEAEAQKLAADNPSLRYIILGHYHVALDEKVGSDCRLIITGNWINESTYAVFDGKNVELREFF